MWNQRKRSRFALLRQRERQCLLTDAERAELESLLQEFDSAESQLLTPATNRLREERKALETQNRALEALTRRKEVLIGRLRDFLNEAQSERSAIDSELAAVLAEPEGREGPD